MGFILSNDDPLLQEFFDKISKPSNPCKAAASRNLFGFWNDVEAFTESKRFSRFVDTFEMKATEFLGGLNLTHGTAGGYQLSEKNTLPEVLKRLLMGYVLKTLYKGGEKDITAEPTPEGRKSFLDVVNVHAPRVLSNAESLQKMIDEIEETYDLDEREPEDIVWVHFRQILDNDEYYNIAYNISLRRVCYDFVHLKALENGLSDDNWLSSLKQFTPEQLMFLICKLFEYILFDTEDITAFKIMQYKEETDSFVATLSKAQALMSLFSSEKAGMTTQIEELTKALKEKSATIERLKAEKKANTQATESAKKNKELQHKLSEKNREYEKLKAKYDAAIEQNEAIAKAAEEDQSEVPVNSSVDLDKIKDKRIVFIRDKMNENFVLFKRLSKMFPNARFTDSISTDIDVHATDLIVCMTAYICHSAYYKAFSVAKGGNVPVTRIANSNVDMIIKHIATVFAKGN